jgi:putative addiction module component (TIGR02574 family)
MTAWSKGDLDMAQEPTALLKEALQLPPEARAALAGALLDSLDETIDEDAETAWEAEIAKRVKELRAGDVRLVPWAEARRQIAGR